METRRKFHIITYGCQMNVADSEMMSGVLKKIGYTHTKTLKEADLILINTCAVRTKPEAKVYGRLSYLSHIKEDKPSLLIGICGCVAQKERENITKKHPYVDMVFGPQSIGELPKLIELAEQAVSLKMKYIENKKTNIKLKRKLKGAGIYGDFASAGDNLPEADVSRTSSFKAYVTIMRGCNNFCSYCVVPYTRGREKSRPFEAIYGEVKQLVEKGYREITLLGQNVNSYKGENGQSFADLLKAIDKIEGHFYVRFMTSHPKDLSDSLIDAIADSRHLAPHVHLPFQSGSTEILKAMNRRYTREHYLKLIEKIKSKIPKVTLTTDVITGFPGETDNDFQDTVSLLETVRFDSAFLFFYSEREGTAALELENPVPLETRLKRLDELIQLQMKISTEINVSMTGETHEGIVEGRAPKNEGEFSVRTYDNHVVILNAPEKSDDFIGNFVTMKITAGHNFVLIGEIIN